MMYVHRVGLATIRAHGSTLVTHVPVASCVHSHPTKHSHMLHI